MGSGVYLDQHSGDPDTDGLPANTEKLGSRKYLEIKLKGKTASGSKEF